MIRKSHFTIHTAKTLMSTRFGEELNNRRKQQLSV